MITHVRRISLFVAFVVAAVSAWSTSADAAPIRSTATAQVTVTDAYLSSGVDLEVHGTATCGEAVGQADLFVSGLQVLDWVYAATPTTVSCAAGPVGWHVTVTAYSGWHFGTVTANAILTDSSGSVIDSKNFYL